MKVQQSQDLIVTISNSILVVEVKTQQVVKLGGIRKSRIPYSLALL